MLEKFQQDIIFCRISKESHVSSLQFSIRQAAQYLSILERFPSTDHGSKRSECKYDVSCGSLIQSNTLSGANLHFKHVALPITPISMSQKISRYVKRRKSVKQADLLWTITAFSSWKTIVLPESVISHTAIFLVHWLYIKLHYSLRKYQ